MGDNRPISHFIILGLLGLIWGTSFMFVKIALTSITPLSIVAMRISIGALVIFIILSKKGLKLPDNLKIWFHCLAIGLVGTVVPFFLVSWSVQYIDSAIAAIFMSLTPLFTLVLAHYMTHDEKISRYKILGIICGLGGVISLFYGTIVAPDRSEFAVAGLIALLFTALFYSIASIMIKKLNRVNALSVSAAILISSAAIISPIALILEQPWQLEVSLSSLASVIILGVFATGIATIFLVNLIHQAGATFVAYNTYLIPVVGILAGYIWLDEALKYSNFASIFFIFLGIFLAEKWEKTARNKN